MKNPLTNKPFEDIRFNIKKVEDQTTYTTLDPFIELAKGMIPVYYDENAKVWKIADYYNAEEEHKWYDYDKWQWANAVTVIESERDTYLYEKGIGDEVNINHINTMWVWIPRYKYRIPAGSNPREIDVVFESKNMPKSMGDAINDYLTHPAFTFGTSANKELAGIWVGKFETTETPTTGETLTSLTILPNQPAIQSQTISAMFYGIKNIMQGNTTTYGFTNDNDIHLMKNSEWGAVAYLSNSKYGKWGNPMYNKIETIDDITYSYKEIYINPSSNYTTGYSSGAPAGIEGSSCAYDVINDRGDGTGACGAGASTTGTIYGVYDMSGGTYEYVMGNYNGTIGSSGFDASFFTDINNKYYDKYTVGSTTNVCSGQCYGHALAETSRWYGDFANFANASNPWLKYGGNYSHNANAGAFAFVTTGGDAGSGFRPVPLLLFY